MGIRGDVDAVATMSNVAAVPTSAMTESNVVKAEEEPHADDTQEVDDDPEMDEIDATSISDTKPLLQEIKMTRTSSKKKVKAAQVASTTKSSPTMIPVMSGPSAAARMKRLRGLGYIVFAALNISLMSACIKYATHYVTSHEAVFWRSLLTFILNYGIVRVSKADLYVAPEYRLLLLFRSFVGMVCVSLSYYAMSKMVLTDAIVIIFTSPVLTFLLGAMVLREAIDRVDFVCALSSYIGVLFVSRPAMFFPHAPSTKETNTTAVLAALGAAATQAIAYICMRKLHTVHYMAISHYFSLFGIGFSITTLWFFDISLRIPDGFMVQLTLVLSAVFSCVGMLFLTLGFQMEKAGIASVMRYFDVVFVFILDTMLLGEDVDGYSILGGGIILSGAIIIAVRRARAKK